MSAATFAPTLPAGGGTGNAVRRAMLGRRLEQNRDYFAGTRYLRATNDGELWRISARVEALNSLDYGHFVAALKEQVEPALQETAAAGSGPIDAVYTGIVPLIYKAQRTLLDDLLMSFISAFFIIGGMMMVLLRGVRPGLIAMLPNVFPAIVLFGAMGLSGTLCDIGSMMTAGAALGIAVDDTIHFLTWFRRGMAEGRSRHEAIRFAHAHCARAMIQTTVICGFGLLVFALSSFVPTSRFAWLMAAMLGTGLIGDLIFLPALLAGPLGKYFEPKASSPELAAQAFEPAAPPPELDLAAA
jgi:predicted RND superfamily exporter protein